MPVSPVTLSDRERPWNKREPCVEHLLNKDARNGAEDKKEYSGLPSAPSAILRYLYLKLLSLANSQSLTIIELAKGRALSQGCFLVLVPWSDALGV